MCSGVLISSLLALGTPVPARASLYTATCVVNLTFTFSATLSAMSGTRTIGITGGGTCAVTLNGITDVVRTLTLSATGLTSTISTCSTIVAAGTTYSAGFSPSPSPPSSPGGPITFAGNASGGTLILSPLTVFKGVGTLVSVDTACALGGTSRISYVGVLEIVDP